MSQISDSQALIESSAVTAQGQAVLSQSESELAIAHAVSTAAADSSRCSTVNFGDKNAITVDVMF